MPVIEVAPVAIPVGEITLDGDLELADRTLAVVAVAHLGTESRLTPQSHVLIDILRREGLGTLVLDLLTADEKRKDDAGYGRHVDFLARRLLYATEWLGNEPRTRGLPVGLMSRGAGTAAAIRVAAALPDAVSAIVSIDGRPDMAGAALSLVQAPLLLAVHEPNARLLQINEDAAALVRAPTHVEVVAPGDDAALPARDWLVRHLVQIDG